jgi:hypothetical protein
MAGSVVCLEPQFFVECHPKDLDPVRGWYLVPFESEWHGATSTRLFVSGKVDGTGSVV